MDDIFAEMNKEDSVLLAKFKGHNIKTNIPLAQIPVGKTDKKDKDNKKCNSKEKVSKEKKKSTKRVTVDDVAEPVAIPASALTFDQLPKSEMTAQEVLQTIGRDINCIDDASNVSLRKSALQKLRKELFETVQFSYACYNFIFREICKTLFRRFADESEKCRELSYELVNQFFLRATDIQPVLAYYFPSLYHRLPSPISYDEEMKIFIFDMEAHDAFRRGKAVDRQDKLALSVYNCAGKESSEEIRLLACQGLGLVIKRCATLGAISILHPYFHEIIIYLQAQVRDTFPELKAEACFCLEILAEQEECNLGMKYFAVALVRSVLPILRHRLAKVRISALSCLRAVITVKDVDKQKGAGSDAIVELVGFREENNLSVAAFYKPETRFNYLAELVNDNSVAVREKLVELITELLTVMQDRFDHQQRLTPYLLDLLTDDAPSVSEGALNCLKRCGQLYEEEHGEDIIEKRQYGVDGDETILNLEKPPVPPFRERPRIGVRLYVRGQVKRFLFALVNELTSWQSTTRMKSAHLLRVVVYLCEEHLTMEAYKLFPSLIKAIHFARMDGDKLLHHLVLESCEIVGRYTDPSTYIHYVLPRLRGDVEVSQFGADVSMRISILQLLSALLSGSRPTVLAEHFTELVDTLTDPYVIDFDSSVSIRVCVLDVILTLLHALVRSGRGKAAVEAHFLKTGRLTNLKSSIHKLFTHLLTNISVALEESSDADTPVSVLTVSSLSSVVNPIASTGKTTITQTGNKSNSSSGHAQSSAEMVLLKDRSSVALILLSALDSVYAKTIGTTEHAVAISLGSTIPSLDSKLCSLVLVGVNDIPVSSYYYDGYMYDLQRLFTTQLGLVVSDVVSNPYSVLASCSDALANRQQVADSDFDWELHTVENQLLRSVASCQLLLYSADSNTSHVTRVSQICQDILGYCCDTVTVAINARSGLHNRTIVKDIVLFHLRVVLTLMRNIATLGSESAFVYDKHDIFNNVFGDAFQPKEGARTDGHNKLKAVSRNTIISKLNFEQVLDIFILTRDFHGGVAGISTTLSESKQYQMYRHQLLELLLSHDLKIRVELDSKLDNHNNSSYFIDKEELILPGAEESDLLIYPPMLYISAIYGPSNGGNECSGSACTVMGAAMVSDLIATFTPSLLQLGGDAALRVQTLQNMLSILKLSTILDKSMSETGSAVAKWIKALGDIDESPRVRPFAANASDTPAVLLPTVSALLVVCAGALLDDSRDRVRHLALQIVRYVASTYIRPDGCEAGADNAQHTSFSSVVSNLTRHLLKECSFSRPPSKTGSNNSTGSAEPVRTELDDLLRVICVLDPTTAETVIRKCFEEFTTNGVGAGDAVSVGSGMSKFNPASSAVSGLLEHCDMLVQFSAIKK